MFSAVLVLEKFSYISDNYTHLQVLLVFFHGFNTFTWDLLPVKCD